MEESFTAELQLLRRAATGDEHGWRQIIERYHPRLRRIVSARLDRRLQCRLTASDVLQEAYLEAAKKLPGYLENPPAPFYPWLRGIAGNKLLEQHRRHLGLKKRAATREVAMHDDAHAPAGALAVNNACPKSAAVRSEIRGLVREAMAGLDPLDRRVLVLRQFKHLSNSATAMVLNIEPSAASKRYVRALDRLKRALGGIKGSLGMSDEG